MNVNSGSGGITPLILKSGTKWETVVNFKPHVDYPWERNPVPVE
jgi:hypothetical protein